MHNEVNKTVLYFIGLSWECIQMLHDFVKEKATRLIKWKGKKKTAKYKHGKKNDAQVKRLLDRFIAIYIIHNSPKYMVL
jgi:hypothetical protein